MTFNRARSITVMLSSGHLVSSARLKLENEYVSEMRWRRNSRDYRLRKIAKRLNCSVKLSARRGALSD
jgi:hypothetical protein